MNRRRRGITIGIVMVTLLASTCSDPDQELADAGLLRIEDLPPGFRSLASEDDLPSEGSDAGPGACDSINEVVGVGTVIEGAAGPFMGPNVVVANDVAVYREAGTASRVLQVWADEENALGCVELTLSAFVEIGTTDPFFDAAFGGYEVSASPLAINELGDERAAWRGDLTLHGTDEQEERAYIDIVPIRVERAVVTFLFFAFGVPADDLREPVLDSVLDRLAAESE